jgi:hypothetical protein
VRVLDGKIWPPKKKGKIQIQKSSKRCSKRQQTHFNSTYFVVLANKFLSESERIRQNVDDVVVDSINQEMRFAGTL